MDFPSKNGDFPLQNVSSPGFINYSRVFFAGKSAGTRWWVTDGELPMVSYNGETMAETMAEISGGCTGCRMLKKKNGWEAIWFWGMQQPWYLGQFQKKSSRPNPVLPSPGIIMVNFRESIPIYGRTIINHDNLAIMNLYKWTIIMLPRCI